jgi:lysozyme
MILANNQRVSDQLVDYMKKAEGFRSLAYECPAGKLTVGYGKNIEDLPGLTEEQASVILQMDLVIAAKEVDSFAPKDIGPNRRAALVAMVFQLGMPTVKKFKKMLAALEQGNWLEAADQALDSRWARQTPSRAKWVAEILKTGEMNG